MAIRPPLHQRFRTPLRAADGYRGITGFGGWESLLADFYNRGLNDILEFLLGLIPHYEAVAAGV